MPDADPSPPRRRRRANMPSPDNDTATPLNPRRLFTPGSRIYEADVQGTGRIVIRCGRRRQQQPQ